MWYTILQLLSDNRDGDKAVFSVGLLKYGDGIVNDQGESEEDEQIIRLRLSDPCSL